MQQAPLVLVVDDDDGMRRSLRTTLCDEQLRVVEGSSGADALAQAAAHKPELIVLDYTLPDIDGVEVTSRLREWSVAPILMLSARHDEPIKVASLDAGANDYVTKPFRPRELIARIRVWLRQSQRPSAEPPSATMAVQDLRIDLASRRAYAGDKEVVLTPTQFRLFAVFMRNPGKVITHAELLTSVWGADRTKETQYLRVFMGQLRSKFEQDPVRCRYFLTELGAGYKLAIE